MGKQKLMYLYLEADKRLQKTLYGSFLRLTTQGCKATEETSAF